MLTRIIIIGCAKTKAAGTDRIEARQLYTSPLFSFRRRYAERTVFRWLILSAKHGLLDPCEKIPPYDMTAMNITPGQRDQLRHAIAKKLTSIELADGATIEIHAGELYSKLITDNPYLAGRRFTVINPMHGLGIGQQLARYKQLEAA